MPEQSPAAALVPEPDTVNSVTTPEPDPALSVSEERPHGEREAPPSRRESATYKMRFGGHTFYVMVGRYADGRICEVFFQTGQAGSTSRGYTDVLAITVSHYLQLGGSVQAIIDKYRHTEFQPRGHVTVCALDIEYVTSPADALAQVLQKLIDAEDSDD